MVDYSKLIEQLRNLDTEQVNPDTVDIDRLSAIDICRKINREDATVATIVENALEPISRAANIFADTIRTGGRVLYVGAGTSGRLGVLDAAECPPTFGTDPDMIVGLISGGYAALVLSIEGMEDNKSAAAKDLDDKGLTAEDFVIGICASKRTPYTLAALEHAASKGCKTGFIICNEPGELPVSPDVVIALPVGPEVVTGSTRMKSGTAQKMAINMISTTAMVLLGKTYGNLMVDLKATSEKLAARSRRILMDLFQLSLEESDDLLKESDGSVKIALVMKKFRCNKAEALKKLDTASGLISKISG
jgi:N-acetylmuramic acid 6-phosphate etherase